MTRLGSRGVGESFCLTLCYKLSFPRIPSNPSRAACGPQALERSAPEIFFFLLSSSLQIFANFAMRRTGGFFCRAARGWPDRQLRPGILRQQPVLAPGEYTEYTVYTVCPSWGAMMALDGRPSSFLSRREEPARPPPHSPSQNSDTTTSPGPGEYTEYTVCPSWGAMMALDGRPSPSRRLMGAGSGARRRACVRLSVRPSVRNPRPRLLPEFPRPRVQSPQ